MIRVMISSTGKKWYNKSEFENNFNFLDFFLKILVSVHLSREIEFFFNIIVRFYFYPLVYFIKLFISYL